MTTTDLNTAPEAIRKYLLSLLARDGTVLELDGRPVAQVLPYRKPPTENGSDDWSPEKNRRRCELVDLEIDGRISPDERWELRDLERQLDKHIDLVAPRPLEQLRKLHADLLAAAQGDPAGP